VSFASIASACSVCLLVCGSTRRCSGWASSDVTFASVHTTAPRRPRGRGVCGRDGPRPRQEVPNAGLFPTISAEPAPRGSPRRGRTSPWRAIRQRLDLFERPPHGLLGEYALRSCR
jgi:hypothetical protein